jgi:hypothetical protein
MNMKCVVALSPERKKIQKGKKKRVENEKNMHHMGGQSSPGTLQSGQQLSNACDEQCKIYTIYRLCSNIRQSQGNILQQREQ